ncbi:AAEL005157-PA, partial [Aedes aegypti]
LKISHEHHSKDIEIDRTQHASTSDKPEVPVWQHFSNQFGNDSDSQDQGEMESDSDIDENNMHLKADMIDFRDELKNWAIKFQIKHAALNSLLTLLKSHITDNVLPKDARTLVGTPRNTSISADPSIGGEYWHYGLRKVLDHTLSSYDKLPSKLSLNVNIDGLPTFKSSTTSFWPILVNVHELRRSMSPLVVGVFCGTCKFANFIVLCELLATFLIFTAKPKDINVFLSPFVNDLNDVLENGLTINQQKISINLRCFICDTPARSMLRG